VLAVLTGFALAPHNHVHPVGTRVGDDHHHRPGSGVVKHAHLTVHQPAVHDLGAEHHDTGEADHGQDQSQVVSAADEFLFQVTDGPRCPAPSESVLVTAVAQPTLIATASPMLQSPAHGPPEGRSTPSRAPPPVPVAAV
jgi:hypothetical protein